MKRQKKFKKINLPSMFESIKDFLVKRIAGLAIIIIFILIAILLVKAFLYRSDYFRLRTIETRGTFIDQKMLVNINNQLLNAYKGRNIFSINFSYVAESLQGSYPDTKEVVVRIALPDRLVITMKFRKAIALVRSSRLYAIDEDGVILPSADLNTSKDLPVIEGINRFSTRNLKLALDLLKEVRRARFMDRYGLEKISAGDAKNLSFYLKNGIEVKIGSENFKERLNVLDKTLRDPRLVIDMIKYIDVRFNDVAIGPK